MRKIIFPIIVALSLLSKTAMADSDASAWLRSKQSQIISKQGLDSILDYQKLAEDSMGAHWAEASLSQKEDVKRLLAVIIKSSISKRLPKSKTTEIKWNGEEIKENLTIVKSTFSQKKKTSEEPLEVDFVIQQSGDGFKVILHRKKTLAFRRGMNCAQLTNNVIYN